MGWLFADALSVDIGGFWRGEERRGEKRDEERRERALVGRVGRWLGRVGVEE